LRHESLASLREKSAFISVHQWLKTPFCQTNPNRKIRKPLRINQVHKKARHFGVKNEPKYGGRTKAVRLRHDWLDLRLLKPMQG
jgi:hypothetical protein